MTLLQCKQLEFGYGQGFAAPCDFQLDEGEVIGLMGRNGCGKSTLLKTLCGKIPAVNGSVELLDRALPLWSAQELSKKVAYLSISKAAPERMTVREFVSLGRMPYSGIFDGRNAEDERIVDDAIELLQLSPLAYREVSTLSDGERSRVYLAEAVAQQVKVLLLDEPNAFLDIPWSHQLFKTLKSLAENRGMGIVVSTHSLEYAKLYCHRLMVVDLQQVHVGTVAEMQSCGALDWTKG